MLFSNEIIVVHRKWNSNVIFRTQCRHPRSATLCRFQIRWWPLHSCCWMVASEDTTFINHNKILASKWRKPTQRKIILFFRNPNLNVIHSHSSKASFVLIFNFCQGPVPGASKIKIWENYFLWILLEGLWRLEFSCKQPLISSASSQYGSHNHIRSDTQENNLPPAHRIVWTVVIMAEARPLARPIRQRDDAFQNPDHQRICFCKLLYWGILRVNGRVIPVRLWCWVYQYFLSTLSSVISSLDKPKAKYWRMVQ